MKAAKARKSSVSDVMVETTQERTNRLHFLNVFKFKTRSQHFSGTEGDNTGAIESQPNLQEEITQELGPAPVAQGTDGDHDRPGAIAVIGPGPLRHDSTQALRHDSTQEQGIGPGPLRQDSDIPTQVGYDPDPLISAVLVESEHGQSVYEATALQEDRLTKRCKLLFVAFVLVIVMAAVVLAVVLTSQSDNPTIEPMDLPDPTENNSTESNSTAQPTWTRLGRDIAGKEEFDRFGHTVDLSDDGVLAIGASNGAYVRVFEYDSNEEWRQRGNDIVVPNWGGSVAISANGTVVAVGDMFSSYETYGGQVFVYRWSVEEPEWILMGKPINGTMNGEKTGEFGRSVALSADGTVVAVGAWFAGQATVFEFTGQEWIQVGDIIEAPSEDSSSFGMSVALSGNGRTVAVGDPGMYQVVIFDHMHGNWIRTDKGGLNSGGETEDETLVGGSVSISRDGSKVAAGSYGVKIFGLEHDAWSLQFSDNVTMGSSYGNKVDMSADGSVVAGRGFDGIRIFSTSEEGVWTQLGQDVNDTDIDGDFDESDRSIALSANGRIFAVGSVYQEVGGGPGFVRVFRLSQPDN